MEEVIRVTRSCPSGLRTSVPLPETRKHNAVKITGLSTPAANGSNGKKSEFMELDTGNRQTSIKARTKGKRQSVETTWRDDTLTSAASSSSEEEDNDDSPDWILPFGATKSCRKEIKPVVANVKRGRGGNAKTRVPVPAADAFQSQYDRICVGKGRQPSKKAKTTEAKAKATPSIPASMSIEREQITAPKPRVSKIDLQISLQLDGNDPNSKAVVLRSGRVLTAVPVPPKNRARKCPVKVEIKAEDAEQEAAEDSNGGFGVVPEDFMASLNSGDRLDMDQDRIDVDLVELKEEPQFLGEFPVHSQAFNPVGLFLNSFETFMGLDEPEERGFVDEVIVQSHFIANQVDVQLDGVQESEDSTMTFYAFEACEDKGDENAAIDDQSLFNKGFDALDLNM